jgi:hypothetical protein
MQQVVTMLHDLLSADQGLHVKSVRLSAPREGDAAANWRAELTLTYWIYDPSTGK